MEPQILETFQLVDDFSAFSDKGVLRKQKNYFIGSRKYDLCYKIPVSIYRLMGAIIEPLKLGKVSAAFDSVSNIITHAEYVELIAKLDQLGFSVNSCKRNLVNNKFDETELTMIRLFSIDGKHVNFSSRLSYKTILYGYFGVMALLLLICIRYFAPLHTILDREQLEVVPYLFAYFASYLIHECAHIVVARLNHIPIKSITCAFYFDAVPVLFVKYNNMRFFPSRSRLRVSLAGVSANLLLIAIAVSCSSINSLRSFCISVFYVNTMMVLSCMMPLKLGDGYFALCDLLGVDNLRKFVFSFALHRNDVGKIPHIKHLYLVAFIIFYVITIATFISAAIRVWNSSTEALRILLLLYLAFSLLFCGIVFFYKLIKKRQES